MVIHEIFKSATRNRIAFFEENPPSNAKNDLRGFTVDRLDSSSIMDPNELLDIAGVIFQQNPARPNKIEFDLEQYAKRLLLYDCRVFIVPAPPDNSRISYREHIVNAIHRFELPYSGLQTKDDETYFTPTVHVLDPNDAFFYVAKYLHDFPPEASPSLTLEIELVNEKRQTIELSFEDTTLIRRAFNDCFKVKLIENSDGRSGVSSYRAYATARYHSYQTPPYQYFVKIGKRAQIAKEYLAYRDKALEHVPFHLGPRLRLDRCALGAEKGIIVSDYVSNSEKLCDCARDGRAVPVIANLFNTTLRAWHHISRDEDQPLQNYLRDMMPKKIPKARKKIIEKIEIPKSPSELMILLEEYSSSPVQIGVVHGDLHSLNILVRGVDAIVIDFEKVEENKPLLIDLTSLEAGLLIDGFIGDHRTIHELLKSIEPLIEIDTLIQHKNIKFDPSYESAWFFDCVRQIRMHAREIEQTEGQYALTLAVMLAKKACKEPLRNVNSDRRYLSTIDLRAIAYILAQRILIKYSQHNSDSETE